jgi:hypothetical protein
MQSRSETHPTTTESIEDIEDHKLPPTTVKTPITAERPKQVQPER